MSRKTHYQTLEYSTALWYLIGKGSKHFMSGLQYRLLHILS